MQFFMPRLSCLRNHRKQARWDVYSIRGQMARKMQREKPIRGYSSSCYAYSDHAQKQNRVSRDVQTIGNPEPRKKRRYKQLEGAAHDSISYGIPQILETDVSRRITWKTSGGEDFQRKNDKVPLIPSILCSHKHGNHVSRNTLPVQDQNQGKCRVRYDRINSAHLKRAYVKTETSASWCTRYERSSAEDNTETEAKGAAVHINRIVCF